MSENHTAAESGLSGTEPGTRVVNLEKGRRAFLQTLGLGIAGAAILGGSTGSSQAQGLPADVTDADILNFALNLEYLEAEFYLNAVNGSGLKAGDLQGVGAIGAVNGGGRAVPFADANVRKYAFEIAADEEAHVRFLRAALGSAAVSRPRLDIDFAFTAAARAAGLIGASDRFDAYANDTNFLLASFIFEDVGVTAYNGAAGAIQNKTFLSAAASILAVEAYHAGIIRTTLYARGLITQANAISNARDSLDGTTDLDQGISGDQSATPGFSPSDANLVPTDRNGLVFARTPGQVLDIVYLNTTQSPGGFFPGGLNGRLR
ncbi:ferritin-like domain-containing protein [uncultured Methylobacterium sp.]|uniref:ferritin-like domain-containing protein n=1 Tax=uncultured Methylobacterium sp. TaxID=157278 RepID=UPI0035C98526